MLRAVRLGFAAGGLVGGFYLAVEGLSLAARVGRGPLGGWEAAAALAAGSGAGALVLYAVAPVAIGWVVGVTRWIEGRLRGVPAADIMTGTLGTIVALVIGYLFGPALARIPVVGNYLPIAFSALLGYLGWSVSTAKRDDFQRLLASLWARSPRGGAVRAEGGTKVVDTSAIIDGRIGDLVRTGFLEGTLVVPQFVLDELRHIADSSDGLRRSRGRRGLDVLKAIQKERKVSVVIAGRDPGRDLDVDTRVVLLARELGAKVITTDYNLNKVAELQGVPVLNVNELATALKPVFLPGEEMVVRVLRDGKESGQGVGYLDDGTMIVVEGGKRHIGEEVAIEVTSVLQTAAGRMIFGRVKGRLANSAVGGAGRS
jgi:uncharacterized protein YacL